MKCLMCFFTISKSTLPSGHRPHTSRYSKDICTGFGVMPANKLYKFRVNPSPTGTRARDVPGVTQQCLAHHYSISTRKLPILHHIFVCPHVAITDHRDLKALFQQFYLAQICGTMSPFQCGPAEPSVQGYPRTPGQGEPLCERQGVFDGVAEADFG